jgi:hypothetical protein
MPVLEDDHRSKATNIQRRKCDMQSTTRFCAFCAMTLTAAGLLFAPAANAQQQSPSAPPSTAPGPKTAPANISDSKLDAAAAAVKKVSTIQDTYRQKLAQAPVTEKERLVGEANNAMEKAVTDQGLSVDEYTTILELAQNDPIVRNKMVQRMK